MLILRIRIEVKISNKVFKLSFNLVLGTQNLLTSGFGVLHKVRPIDAENFRMGGKEGGRIEILKK
jgi:hypothetical protein